MRKYHIGDKVKVLSVGGFFELHHERTIPMKLMKENYVIAEETSNRGIFKYDENFTLKAPIQMIIVGQQTLHNTDNEGSSTPCLILSDDNKNLYWSAYTKDSKNFIELIKRK